MVSQSSLELTDMASLTGQFALGYSLSSSPEAGVTDKSSDLPSVYVGYEDSSSSPHTGASTTHLPPPPQSFFLCVEAWMYR